MWTPPLHSGHLLRECSPPGLRLNPTTFRMYCIPIIRLLNVASQPTNPLLEKLNPSQYRIATLIQWTTNPLWRTRSHTLGTFANISLHTGHTCGLVERVHTCSTRKHAHCSRVEEACSCFTGMERPNTFPPLQENKQLNLVFETHHRNQDLFPPRHCDLIIY